MKCIICGEEIPLNRYTNDQELREHQMCFDCNFWRDMLERDAERPPYTCCVIDGTHYVIEPDEPNSFFKGFGGAEFHIYFDDGYEVVTHNLWCQGEPEGYWKEKFPNNAKFDWEWKKIGTGEYLVPKK